MGGIILKIVGSGLILTASLGLAICIRKEMKEHLRCLFELRSLLYEIFWEMNYSMQPVEMVLLHQVWTNHSCVREILTEIGEKLRGKSDGLGEEIWQESFAKRRQQLGLKEEESEIIEQAGSAFFGKSMEENQKMLSLYLERLDFLIEGERKERREKQKVYQTVCVMSGLVLVILLV